jgi:hypothetical protein
MPNCSFSMRWTLLAAATVLCSVSCSKPQPSAPTQDFARRHQCAVTAVESQKEAPNRMRLTGCGESEIYVRNCENRGVSYPDPQVSQPITEAEAKHSSPRRSNFNEQGCAWTRAQNTSAPRAGGTQQPKWLSPP